jgi:hypothetical protein
VGKYEPLAGHLASLPTEIWNARFEEVEAVLGFPLPQSAYRHRAWWANQNGANHSQTEGWRSAGWETREVDFKHRTVRFERAGRSTVDAPPGSGRLWEEARRITGIDDRDALMEAALNALIRREAAAYLTSLGGTMPDAAAVPRRHIEP